MKLKTASGPVLAFMKLMGFTGWASFWETIYVLPGHEHNSALVRHEMRHLEQIRRDGRVKFTVQYLWWLIRYGYWDNPYERDAREAEKP